MIKFKSYSMKLAEKENNWYVIDAEGIVLGRLAALIATRLRGKHKPEYTPHMDCGDNIVVINANKVKTTAQKLFKKEFFWHTGYPGGIKSKIWFDILNGKNPERLLIKAVERMITKGPLRRRQMKRFFVYNTDTHNHQAQNPVTIDVASLNSKNKR